MTPERWEQITEIYHSARELDNSEQKAFIEKMCANDEFLRREVESLLAADAEAGDFIAEPVVKDAASFFLAESEPSLAGRNLGHYKILSRIGTGGMGEVYLAKDSKLNRPVALKTLPVSYANHPDYLQRFQTEAEAAATLNHPNVATIYSVEKIDEQPFITMEYVEGKTLDAFIPARGLDLKTFLEWFTQLAAALSHAHEKGIVHRDIKPGNIMITTDDMPKILDFGLAQIDKTKIADDVLTLEMPVGRQILGTPSYMSPEQAEGKEVDARSDIFSFGVVMYEAITGTRPFTGDSYAALMSELINKDPRPITRIKPETPYLLARLITRCLHKTPRHRFQTMREVCIVLREIKAAVEAGISLSSAPNLLLSASTNVSRPWILAPSALMIVILAFSAFYYFRPNPPPPINFQNVTLRKLSQTNNVAYAHITPDGKSVVYQTIEENDGRGLWIRRVEDKKSLQLVPPQSVSFWGGLSVSPDGSQIYYITAARDARHGTLYRISALGGAPRKLIETVNDLGSISPDGSRVLYVRYGEQMQLLSANAIDGSGERVVQTGASNVIFRDPQFSADGKSIYLIKFERITGKEFWSLIEIPAAGGAEKTILARREPRIGEIAVLKDGNGLLVNATDPISNIQQLYHVNLPDGAETRVTNDLNFYYGISASDDGKTIVASQREFAKDVWVTGNESRETLRKLTTEPNVYLNAVYTPDGRIVYDAADNNRPHIWIMNGDGTGAQQLTPNDSFDFEPQVSPDGRYIVFTSERTGERKVWRMNIDGTNPQLLTPVSGTTAGAIITPDGQTVLFSWTKENKRALGKVPLAGGEITEHELFSEKFFALSPDGKQLAYTFYDEPHKRYRVGIRPIESDAPTIVFNISPTNFVQWTRDGKNLLYRELEPRRALDSIIWQQPVTGGEPKPFLSVKPDSAFNISQSHDGRKIAIVRGKLVTDAVMLTKVEPLKR